VNAEETEVIAQDRAARRAWLEARGYRVCLLNAGDVERDVTGQLDLLAGA
jgi:tRNA/rRNA methyltransferase